ncbi:MAG: T6SS immunity protein Tli4 family protein, partial [Betaproteobacteria bacterium]|nr:T6SS immunity protein Tli4 family protein [Betaproteobacteria bacterium]
MPVEVEAIGWDNSYNLGTIEVGFGVPKYREMLDATLKKLKNKEDRYEYVKSEYPEGGDKQIIISRVDLFGDMSYAVDAFTLNPKYIPGAGYFFYLSGKSYDENRMDEIISRYKAVLSNIRYRPDSEIPTEPGFCFKDGFIANDGKVSQGEMVEVRFKLKSNPDVVIEISSDVSHVVFPPLLERLNAGEQKLPLISRMKISKIRQGKREINGMPGEESVVTFPAEDKTGTVHDFSWETMGEMDNPLKPNIQIDVESGYDETGMGGATASSLDTKQMLQLFEAIVKTIRFRPVTENPSDGKAKPESSPPAPSQPGAQAPEASPQRVSTGQPCPKTGLWRCV